MTEWEGENGIGEETVCGYYHGSLGNGSWKSLCSSSQANGKLAFVGWYSSRSSESFRVWKCDWTLYFD